MVDVPAIPKGTNCNFRYCHEMVPNFTSPIGSIMVNTDDGRNPANQLRLIVYSTSYRDFIFRVVSRISSINSMSRFTNKNQPSIYR